MGNYNTEIGKFANMLLHADNIKETIEHINNAIDGGLLTQDDKGNTILHYLTTKDAHEQMKGVFEFVKKKFKSLGFSSSDEAIKQAINLPNHKGMRLAHIVFGFECHKTLQLLLEHKVDLYTENASRMKPLEIAVQQDKREILLEFYELCHGKKFGLDYSAFQSHYAGQNLLHIAVSSEAVEVFKLLVNKKELQLVNAKDYEGNTPLHLAAKAGDSYFVKRLVECGAQIDAKNGQNKTAIEYAFAAGSDNIVGDLLRSGAGISRELATQIGERAVANIVDTIISETVDALGTFVGFKKDQEHVDKIKHRIAELVADMKIQKPEDVKNQYMSSINEFFNNITNAKIDGLAKARNVEEIKQTLTPIFNNFIKEVTNG